MNPWKTLNIKPTDDKKVIKKAYAVLIKQYKPDEHPEKFKEIQAAYKLALDILNWDSSNNVELVETHRDTVNEPNAQVGNLQQINKIDSQEEKIATELIKHLSEILTQDQNEIDKMRNWDTFKRFNAILDIQLKRNLSYKLFEAIAQFNLKYQEDKNKAVIHLSIIEYLDGIFDWSTNWQDLLNQFPQEYIEVTLQRTEKKIKLDTFVTPIISRAFGFYFDYLFAILVVFIFKWVSFKYFAIKYEQNTLSYLLISTFFLQRILMESLLRTRRSIGKIVRNLYILDLNGFYINVKKSLHRHYLIALNLTPYFLYLFKIKFDELVFLGLIITIIIVNVISYATKGCLLHDLINKTRVLESD